MDVFHLPGSYPDALFKVPQARPLQVIERASRGIDTRGGIERYVVTVNGSGRPSPISIILSLQLF